MESRVKRRFSSKAAIPNHKFDLDAIAADSEVSLRSGNIAMFLTAKLAGCKRVRLDPALLGNTLAKPRACLSA